MLTCFIKYIVDLDKLSEFEEYAKIWIELVTKYGGIHHGYYLPSKELDEVLNNNSFSFANIGKAGPKNIAVALFSFENLEKYLAYKEAVAEDEKCKTATALFTKSKCFLSYERSFLRPLMGASPNHIITHNSC